MTTPVHIISGVCVGVIVSDVFGLPLINSIPLAVIFSNIQDITGLFKEIRHHHNDISHYPLLLLIPSIALFFIGFVPVWLSVTIFSSLLLHSFLDTFGQTIGVKWLYPFSAKEFSFLPLFKDDRELTLRERVDSYFKKKLYFVEVFTGTLILVIASLFIAF